MNNLNFWKKSSSISGIICFVLFILFTFCYRYILPIIGVMYPLAVVLVIIFLISELMKFIIKKNIKTH